MSAFGTKRTFARVKIPIHCAATATAPRQATPHLLTAVLRCEPSSRGEPNESKDSRCIARTMFRRHSHERGCPRRYGRTAKQGNVHSPRGGGDRNGFHNGKTD